MVFQVVDFDVKIAAEQILLFEFKVDQCLR